MSKYLKAVYIVMIFFLLITFNNISKISCYAQDISEEYSDVIEKSSENSIFMNNDCEVSSTLLDTVISLLIEIVGAFLGFISAIAFAKRSEKKQADDLDKSLKAELSTIYNELFPKVNNNNFDDYYRYVTPIWQINVSSGALASVTNDKVYKKYINIYSRIQYAEELEEEYSKTKFHASPNYSNDFNIYLKAIDDARKREAKNICDMINEEILKEDR